MRIIKSVTVCLILLCLVTGLFACGKGANSGSDWVWAYNQRGAFSDQGYYYLTAGGFLRFVDLTSGVSVCLCSKPGCLHDQEPDNRKSEVCEAKLIGASIITPLFFWSDGLYYILEDPYGAHVYRRNATGTDLETVATLGKEYINEQQDVTVYAYAAVDGFLYYSADVDGSIRTADGGNMVQWISNYLGRLDLQTGKEEVLLDRSDVYITLCAVKGNEALFHTAGVPDATYDDPDYRQLRLEMPAKLEHWDGTDGQINTILESTVRDFPPTHMVDNSKVYYSVTLDNEHSVYAYDLSTGQLAIVCHDTVRYLGNGYALRLEPDSERWDLFDLNTGKTLPNEMHDKSLWITTVSATGFVVRYSIARDNMSGRQFYSYVPYDSLADGLQEADMMVFYSHSVTTTKD